MINKDKFKLFSKIILLIFLILLLLLIIRVTLGSFESSGSGSAKASVAFYVFDVSNQTKSFRLSDIKPDGKDNIYNISVYNYSNNKVSETDLNYNLYVATTTNIPVNYSLYLNDEADNIMSNRELYTDNNGVYFYKYKSISRSFKHGVKTVDNYKLVVNFPTDYGSYEYQGLIDSIEITVDAKQG